ncbi:MAG: eukaryotic-like serine/threonine-protein kinase, partial [Pseudonocardiales bacterium]|nr:eukaryotic-like serine/threonine-protein kinase [Pseudonocardiales bacterium]
MAGQSKASSGEPSANGVADTTLVANRYEIQELLGRGSMGAVYCARDVVLERDVALKLFPAEAADPQQAVRYEQEARVLARLSHPGLVTVYDAGIDATLADAPRPYLVMELVRGPTLADRLRDGALPPEQVAAVAAQLASALAHIHRREVVHRDVKPANILLRDAEDGSRYPAATLTDFGIARLIDGTRITMTGYTLGTANYLSPEQLNGGEVAAASDIYSLGLVLLECLTGEVV